MNGVAERRNRTLLDMVTSMMSSSKLPISLWKEALKTAVYILNRVPTKIGIDHIEETNSTNGEGTSIVNDSSLVRAVIQHDVDPITQVDDARHQEYMQADQPVIEVEPSQNVTEDVPDEQPQPTQEVELRRSTRERKPALPSDYVVYFTEIDYERYG
ncbi:uncharacterized protein LOC114724429 [Neltuma alba]|uniref:uncharacterized protein LOC114724429 n=1 Tax=Neltuma alba TaxID=207710 RepID=UPI0010A4F7FB|nr:uncharacterized protein LOC114724429 [Prosopis alba]